MTREMEIKPGAVSPRRQRRRRTRPDGEVRGRWSWTEPAIWTDRMLTALEEGIEGGKWLWPNTFFDEHGLFSLVTAHRLVRQSSRR